MTWGSITFTFPCSIPLRNVGLQRKPPGREDWKWLVWVSKYSTVQMGLVLAQEIQGCPWSVLAHAYDWKTWPSRSKRTKLAFTQAFYQLLLFLTTRRNNYHNLFLSLQATETYLWLPWRQAFNPQGTCWWKWDINSMTSSHPTNINVNIVQFLLGGSTRQDHTEALIKEQEPLAGPKPGRNHTKASHHNLLFYSSGILITKREKQREHSLAFH